MSSSTVRSKILAFVLFAALAAVPAATLAQTCNVSLPTGVSTAAGSDFVVPVIVADANGALGMGFRFTYDPARLTATSVYRSSLTQGFDLVSNLTEPGRVHIILYGSTPLAGGGAVAYVTFHTNATAPLGDSPLHWEFADINEGAIDSSTCDGLVSVVVPQVAISAPDFCAASNTTVHQPLVGNPADGLLGLDLTVEYDPLVAEPTMVTPTSFTAGFGLYYHVVVPGQLMISLYGTVPLAGSGPLVDITWHVLAGTGSSSAVRLVSGSVNEGALVTTFDDGVLTVAADADGDGATTCTDCNDADANVYPGAPEICDGIDNQCPGDPGYGQVDENVKQTFYRDLDGDAYGDLAVTVEACAPPVGYVANSTDCNDNDAAVHPGATEIAADGIDENCDGLELCYVDGDRDGYGSTSTVLGTSLTCGGPGEAATSTDCDDANAAIHPGAAETCNGLDDNCNGSIDEGVKLTFHADADGDGYGNPLLAAEACTAPAGYVADGTDCNDTNAAIHPGAAETCNGIDDNCNAAIDEGVTLTFHADADGDGFGGTVTIQACTAPAGYVADGTDCDDANAAVHPGAIEVCNGVDDNCNAAIDEGVQSTFWRDADADGFGDPAVPALACTVPPGYAVNALDCDDTRPAVHPGATEVCNGIDDDCNGATDEGNPGGGLRCGGSNVGECATGLTACVAGAVQCLYEVTPQPETCDGRDNDCDGHVDDGCSAPACNVRLPLETKVGPDADLVVPIVVGDATGATGLTFEFTYDAARLTPVAVYRAALTDGFSITTNLTVPGKVSISLYGTVPVTGGGAVAYVLFHTGATGFGGTPLQWVFADLNEGAIAGTTCDGQVNVVVAERTLSIADFCGATGNTVTTPVTSADATGVLGLDLTIEYDPLVLEPVSVATTSFTAGWGLSFNVPAPGRLLVSSYGSTALAGAGRLFDITWHVIGTATGASPVDLALAEANEGALLVTTDDAVFTGSIDADGDGYAACVDCNDADASIHPHAIEVCDGKDNQCPGDPGYGQIDEGVLLTFHRDADGDGYGDPAVTAEACVAPPGYVTDATDCNDTSNQAYPGGTEICDELDNDCDGHVDNVPAPTGTPTVTVTGSGDAITLTWTGVGGATGYDLVRGLSGPVAGAGDFASAVDACLANDTSTTTFTDTARPVPGEIFWYAVRAENCGGNATWDAIPNDQVRSRDPYINASPEVCP